MKSTKLFPLAKLLFALLLVLPFTACNGNTSNDKPTPKPALIEVSAEGELTKFPQELISANGVVVLPENVKSIAKGVFKGFTQLKSINGPAVVTIGEGAFEGCTELTEAHFVALKEVEASAFKGCTNLATLEVGNTAPQVDATSLEGTPTNKNLVVGSALDPQSMEQFMERFGFATINGKELPKMVISPEGVLTSFPAELIPEDGNVVLPEEVKAIGEGVMKNLPALKTLTAHGVTTIERLGLSGCYNLEKAILPALTDIKAEGFTGCEKLASLTIGATLPSVGNTAFDRTPKNKNLQVPEDKTADEQVHIWADTYKFATVNGSAVVVKHDPPEGFTANGQVINGISDRSKAYKEHIIFPSYFTEIAARVFSGNKWAIKKVTAKGMLKIANSVFKEAGQLVDVDMPKLVEAGDYAFATYGFDLTHLNKLQSLEKAGKECFAGNESLIFISLPSIKELGNDVFFQSPALGEDGSIIEFGATPPDIKGSLGIKPHTLVIPKGAKKNYENWEHKNKFGRILEEGEAGTEKLQEYRNWTSNIQ